MNSGGEKIFPQMVGEALTSHPAIVDAAVIGIPDLRFGEIVTAVITTVWEVNDDGINTHVR